MTRYTHSLTCTYLPFNKLSYCLIHVDQMSYNGVSFGTNLITSLWS